MCLHVTEFFYVFAWSITIGKNYMFMKKENLLYLRLNFKLVNFLLMSLR